MESPVYQKSAYGIVDLGDTIRAARIDGLKIADEQRRDGTATTELSMTTTADNNPTTTNRCRMNPPGHCRVESETPHFQQLRT